MLRVVVLGVFCLSHFFRVYSHEVHGSIINDKSPNFDSPAVFQVTQPVDFGEGPIWDTRKNILYYVDIYKGRVLSYNYYTKKVNFVVLKGTVTPIIPSKNNENIFIVGVNKSLVAIEWDGENDIANQRTLTTVSGESALGRFNDGKADRNGRLWIGTMGYTNEKTNALDYNQGVLYKISRDHLLRPKIEIAPVNISNGLCWNKANDKMYYVDTPTRKVVEYDFDQEKGEITNPRVAIDISMFNTVNGDPDGITIDEDDNLWIALHHGGAVIRANPKTGQLLQVIPIPARDVTSVMWGGPNLDILFVTTSRIGLSDNERLSFPGAGSVFAVTNLKQKGVPPAYADLVDTVRRQNLLAELLSNSNEIFSPLPSNGLANYKERSSNSSKIVEQEDIPIWQMMLNAIRNIF